jgi:hypothetical protein
MFHIHSLKCHLRCKKRTIFCLTEKRQAAAWPALRHTPLSRGVTVGEVTYTRNAVKITLRKSNKNITNVTVRVEMSPS